MTEPVSLDIRPGLIRTVSNVSVLGRYYDADHVRFDNGKPEKIGGWEKLIDEQILGTARGMLGWSSGAGDDLVAVGTYIKAYSVLDTLDDITPLSGSGSLGNDPFAVANGDMTVTVTHTAHGRDVGSYVHFDGATAGGGITIDGEYVVATVIDADHYTIEHTAAATSTDTTTGGASVTYEYEINPGGEGTSYGLGWGAGSWGDDEWGTPRDFAEAIEIEARYWSFARFGTMLAMHPSGGTVYLWDQPNNDDRGEAISNAPASARAMFVTPERMIVMLGTTTPMTLQWNDRDVVTNWTASETSTANTRTLQAGNRLMAGTPYGGDSWIWSDTSLIRMRFLDSTGLIYETLPIATGCGLIARGAFAQAPSGLFWMSGYTFFMLSGGGVREVQRAEEIRSFVFDNFNRNVAWKAVAGYNQKFNEIWWEYASLDSDENDRYVAVSLTTFDWHFGTLARTAITKQDSPVGDLIMAGADRYLYRHEVGKNADGAAMEAYIETGLVALDKSRDVDIDHYIPDFERQVGTITLTLFTKNQPMSTAELERQEFSIPEGTDIVDARMGGRYIGRRITSNEIDGDFREGTPQAFIGPAGSFAP